jgi:hypothetical protein
MYLLVKVRALLWLEILSNVITVALTLVSYFCFSTDRWTAFRNLCQEMQIATFLNTYVNIIVMVGRTYVRRRRARDVRRALERVAAMQEGAKSAMQEDAQGTSTAGG